VPTRRLIDPYGGELLQRGELFLPEQPPKAAICLLHGGYWRSSYARVRMDRLALAMAERDFVVWNLSYRTLGAGGGWPQSGDDVIAGLAHLDKLAAKPYSAIKSLVVVGHSAGGQLALWAAAALKRAGVPIRAVVGLAPLTDLSRIADLRIDNGAVREMFGAGAKGSKLLRQVSPVELLPLGVEQFILHGELDRTVPIEHSIEYVRLAASAGDRVTFRSISNAGHMDFLNPTSAAAEAFLELLGSIGGPSC